MKLTNVALYSNSKQVADLSFKDHGSENPYEYRSIDGLDADQIVSRYYGKSNVTSAKFNSLSLKPRTLVLKIGLNPEFSSGKTYSDLRDDLYASVASSRTGDVTLKFQNDGETVAVLSGVVVKVNADLSDRDPVVLLTIYCQDALLTSPERHSMSYQDLVESTTIIDQKSTSPHGFRAQFTFSGSVDSFVIKDALVPEWTFTIDPTVIGTETGFIAGDVLNFSSEVGSKYLYVTRLGADIHLVDALTPGSVWPILFPKTNEFEISPGPWTWTTMDHYYSYWGV
jgi:hypothetical protein